MILIATQCFPPDRGGIEGLMGGLAQALALRGQEVLVLADPVRTPQVMENGDYQLRRIGGWKPWRRWRKALAVRAAVREGNVTGVFADSWKSVERLEGLQVPLAVLAHGMEFPAQPSARKGERIRRALARADTVIANSSYTAGLVEPYLQGNTRLVVINPPIWPQPSASPESAASMRAVIADGGPVLLTLARLEPRKGVDMVIRALPEIHRKYPQAVYLVAGDGADKGRLQLLAESLGVADSVRFLGAVNDSVKSALYSCADVFAMPARRENDSVEGFGIVYREAGWYGVPALAGRDGGAVDAVGFAGNTEEAGVLCDGADPVDVTAKLLHLLDHTAARTKMGVRASEIARGPAQWSNAVEAFLAALQGKNQIKIDPQER